MSRLITKTGELYDYFSSRLSNRSSKRFWEGGSDLEASRPFLSPGVGNSLPECSLTNQLPPLSRTVTIAENEHEVSGEKLGTFEGCFVPTTLNVMSVLLYIRFPWIVGETGLRNTLLMLVLSYSIGLLTTLSISAICTNGMVRGGGPYYAVSRSIGPEMGGSVGLIFFLGQVLNTGMNVSGFMETVIRIFGKSTGDSLHLLPDSPVWVLLFSSLVLLLCTVFCCFGSSPFARASNSFLVLILLTTLTIPLSAIIKRPFSIPESHLSFTGIRWSTLLDNWKSSYTFDSSGKSLESFRSVFGVFFPATAGLLAGAGMSGDLRNPSRSIPVGTLASLVTTVVIYFLVIVVLASSLSRYSLLFDLQILQDVNIHPAFVIIAILSSSLYSSLVGIFGTAKLLQAIARDNILPCLKFFAGGTAMQDIPLPAILLTYIFTQVTLFWDIDKLSSMITMTFLLTFGIINLACFLLRIGSTPNFRPTFRFFNRYTTLLGCILSFGIMFYVDGKNAFISFLVAAFLFVIINITSPPKNWGDVSEGIIYHQLRKYLLQTNNTFENVKFWRPQVLLLVNNPTRSYNIIRFFNSLKKGSLYMLGHVIVSKDFQSSMHELEKQQRVWHEFILSEKIKAFVELCVAPDEVWGIRTLISSAGLGGIRPNIAVLTFINTDYKNHTATDSLPKVSEVNEGVPPSPEGVPSLAGTDDLADHAISPTQWVQILEDMLVGTLDVMVTYGFSQLHWPVVNSEKKYIDMFPIHMVSNPTLSSSGRQNVLLTNVETYVMVCQLGWILHTARDWKENCCLRTFVLVENEYDIKSEFEKISNILLSLRIKAEIVVLCLKSCDLVSYKYIVENKPVSASDKKSIENRLKNDPWWIKLNRQRSSKRVPHISRPTSTQVSSPTHESLDLQHLTSPLRASLFIRLGTAYPFMSAHSFSQPFYNSTAETPRRTHERSATTAFGHSNIQEGFSFGEQQVESPKEELDEQSLFDVNEHLVFSDLSARAQYIILNELLLRHTRQTAVLFTSLPTPIAGTHKSPQLSDNYVDELLTLLEGLPPCAMVQSKRLTVTTAL
ncbi:arginine transporter Can1 [Schizosaccharomyces japonicus yFS275]|uniref:Arginine transporter Can1 n=1 Tax=Schizosaccharomyces japonicus (strain yFS275 / FY16936) TaxID=402676 RepID=B6K448_SCHJY|nr:arginine transporter Can1 [Schizosaccharomyces japonicus yFS275]EEB08255.1 arginine transporter Can1 [Schizosaccharomyces japonicus yFS275]